MKSITFQCFFILSLASALRLQAGHSETSTITPRSSNSSPLTVTRGIDKENSESDNDATPARKADNDGTPAPEKKFVLRPAADPVEDSEMPIFKLSSPVLSYSSPVRDAKKNRNILRDSADLKQKMKTPKMMQPPAPSLKPQPDLYEVPPFILDLHPEAGMEFMMPPPTLKPQPDLYEVPPFILDEMHPEADMENTEFND